ncbi:MAG TPA: hypothetical protein VF759_07065 [Allosphingosinicella sp.]|jgi:hypothetical protein
MSNRRVAGGRLRGRAFLSFSIFAALSLAAFGADGANAANAANAAQAAANAVANAADNAADNVADNVTANGADNAADPVGNGAGDATGNNGAGNSADEPPPNPEVDKEVYAQVFRLLFIIFALAVVLESGLAVIFNWRPFLRRFDGRGVRTVIAFFAALLIAGGLDLDLIERLYAALDADDRANNDLGPVGEVITALVLAGGSSGVNNIFQALGFRRVGRAEEVVRRPKRTEGWLAVRLHRADAVGPVRVELKKGTEGAWLLIGAITGERRPPAAFAWAVRDETRFPTTGGYSLPENVEVELKLTGVDEDGGPLTWTSGKLLLAGGAIIDLDAKL